MNLTRFQSVFAPNSTPPVGVVNTLERPLMRNRGVVSMHEILVRNVLVSAEPARIMKDRLVSIPPVNRDRFNDRNVPISDCCAAQPEGPLCAAPVRWVLGER